MVILSHMRGLEILILHSACVATMLSGGHQENALTQSATTTVQCRIMPDETVDGTMAAIKAAVADPGITVKPLGTVLSAGESPPNPSLMASVQRVVHSMWPGVMVIPTMIAAASDSIFTRQAEIPSYGIDGGWSDIHDVRVRGRNERHEIGDFYIPGTRRSADREVRPVIAHQRWTRSSTLFVHQCA